MATVDRNTANWRLYGGGGLFVGGILWAIMEILAASATAADVAKWLGIIGLIIVAIGFFLVGWGETGSNGAVGNNLLGKVGLSAASLGALLWGLLPIFSVPLSGTWIWVIAVLVVLGPLAGAFAIARKKVARGLAKWAMYAVFLLALLYFLGATGTVAALANWVIGLIFAIVVALTGLLYLLNRK